MTREPSPSERIWVAVAGSSVATATFSPPAVFVTVPRTDPPPMYRCAHEARMKAWFVFVQLRASWRVPKTTSEFAQGFHNPEWGSEW